MPSNTVTLTSLENTLKPAEGSLVAASTTDLSTVVSHNVQITGTGTITSFGTTANCLRYIRFTSLVTLTHNASTLVLPGAANITTAAGDTAIAVSDATGLWRVFVYQRADGTAINITVPQGQCRFQGSSTTSCTLAPFGGNQLWVSGANRTIPASGVSISNAGLNPSTKYYIYASMAGSALTLEASPTAYVLDPTLGIPFKSGDTSRTLVGMVYTNPSSQFVFSLGTGLVRTWFNDFGLSLLTVASATFNGNSANSYGVSNTAPAIQFLCWAGEVTEADFCATVQGSSSSGAYTFATTFAIDGSAVTDRGANEASVSSAGFQTQTITSAWQNLTEGYHSMSIFGQNTANNGAVMYYMVTQGLQSPTLRVKTRRIS